MSGKESSVYQKSSFDAVESTRRLSEEIANGHTPTSKHRSPQGSTAASTTQEEKSSTNADGEVDDDAIDHVIKANDTKGVLQNDNNNNGYIKLHNGAKERLSPLLDESPCAEEAITTEHLLRFNISRETTKKNEVDNGVSGDLVSINTTVHTQVKSPRLSGQMFDQRSESDSDLSSPDDFSDGELSDQSNGAIKRLDPECHQGDESEGTQVVKDGIPSSVSHDQHASVNGDVHEYKQTSGHTDSSSMKSFTSAKTKVSISSVNKIYQESSHAGNAANGSSPETDASVNDVQYAQLTDQEIGDKLKDDDVLRQGEMLDAVREVSVTNLNKLQQLHWNDPALRRLFMKPRLTTKEVKSVKVDPDIKNMVNEFLKTNVAENFLISRVLRENYATFYSWLASHLQTERNAWTTRFAQALDQADQQRKAALQTRNLVMEAAVRLRLLVKTSSNILFGIPDKSDELFFRGDLNRSHGRHNPVTSKTGGMPRGVKSRGHHATDAGYSSDSNVGVSRLDSKTQYYKATQGMRKVLAPSHYRSVKVAVSKPGKVNYDSDPGESFADSQFINDDSDCEPIHSGVSRHSRVSEQSKVHAKRKLSNASTVHEHADTHVDFSGLDLSGLLLDGDKDSDWNQVLLDNVEVLYEICDTLLVDRKACLQLVKSNPKRCESLVDAVSTFIRIRQNEMNSKRDVERRLKTLESENRALQEEMSTLQKTLADKNRDALNLQTQLDRLESMMKDHTVPKMNKCVGTGDEMFPAVFKNNLTVGSNKTPRQSNHNQTNMPKLTRSPRLVEKEIKTKTVELPSVNGMSNVKHHRNKREPHCPNPGGSTREQLQQEMSSSHVIGQQTKENVVSDSSPPQTTTMVREPSLIEISEEKLKTLKHRAKKLEDSLHDAISSMGKHNTSKHQASGSFADSNINSSIGPFHNHKRVSSIRQPPKTFRNWQKASFEVTSKAQEKVGTNVSSTSRVAVVTRPDSFNKQKDVHDSAPDVRLTLNSEPSSLLEGRPIPSESQDITDPTPASSSLRMTSEKTHAMILHSSRSNFDDSEDERFRHDYDGILTYRRQPDHLDSSLAPESQTQASTKRRTRARHNASSRMFGAKQMVSKCLRCQKLFSPNDNHKLACCYHTKDKERLEHYDQSGMLIRVIHAWKCCNEPQEVEGCCYGQHV